MVASPAEIQEMTDHIDKVVKRQTVEANFGSMYHVDRQTTTYSSVPVCASSDDEFGDFTDQRIPYLPVECMVNGLDSLLYDLSEHGYEYHGELGRGFRSSDNCSLYYVRHVATNIICVAKVVDLYNYRSQHMDIDPCVQAEIAQYITYYDFKSTLNELGGWQLDEWCSMPIENPTDDDHILTGRCDNQPIAENDINVEGEYLGISTEESGYYCNGLTSSDLEELQRRMAGKAHIVWQHDWFVGDGNSLVMIYENCIGGDLHSLIMRARQNGMIHFDEAFIRQVFWQVCRGVSYIHGHGFVHGDIKASNVFFNSVDTVNVKIGDYDTCHLVNSGSLGNIGTLMYMAPEFILDSRISATFEGDVWALGCLLYEMLTLAHPFDSPCTLSTMTTIFSDFPAYRQMILETVPLRYSIVMHIILGRIFEFNPNKRPSVEELCSMVEGAGL